MPKKQRNAFYFFMLDYKEEQRKKGINFASLAEVADVAGSLWKEVPPSVRAKYEARAKQEKNKYNVPETKYTSTGIPLSFIQQQERELKEAEEAERTDITEIVTVNFLDNSLHTMDFFIMDVNSFCVSNGQYLIGESTILKFSLQEGIKEIYHELINPGTVPTGYSSDAKQACLEYDLEMPEKETAESNYHERILAQTLDFMTNGNTVSMSPIFAMPAKIPEIVSFLQQLCEVSGEYDSQFRVYKLDTLFYTLVNKFKPKGTEIFPRASLALAKLQSDPFNYRPKLGCKRHENGNLAIQCTTSRVKRLAFTIFDSCCPLIGVNLTPGKHLPPDDDIEAVMATREKYRQRATTVETPKQQTLNYAGSMSQNDNLSTSSASKVADSVIPETDAQSRAHISLRLPKSDYSQVIQKAPELKLDDRNFPQLTSMGRGRSLSSSLNKMKLGK